MNYTVGMAVFGLLLLISLVGACSAEHAGKPDGNRADAPLVVANDNTQPAGTFEDGVLRLSLVAQPATWRPEGAGGPALPVFAFGEAGRVPSIPAPLIRVLEGTTVELSIENGVPAGEPIGLPPPNRLSPNASFRSTHELIVNGIRAGTVADDVLRVPYGETRKVQYVADRPGTYLYWADTTNRTLRSRTGLDAQLSGAIVVDPLGEPAHALEQTFIITMTDTFDDGSGTLPEYGFFELAINGLSWPHTERYRYTVDDEVRWRWINGSGFEHPMHLHGFHFRKRPRGDGHSSSALGSEAIQEVVTEFMEPGSTFLMEWSPTRVGNWLMHCHIRDHIIPDPPRHPNERRHDMEDVREHPLKAMAGLVLGITVTAKHNGEETLDPQHRLQLVARERRIDASTILRGFSLSSANDHPPDGFQSPGPPVLLTRDEVTRITVQNEMEEPTTVHWHGMELKSYYDGVAGWSGSGDRLAPLVTRDRPFDVFIKPPRAGTFIYHTHMDETEQLETGLYGPLIVLEPEQSFDASTDHILLIGDAIDGDYAGTTINGQRHPQAMVMKPNLGHRFRFINMSAGSTVDVTFRSGDKVLTWTPLAKDGADLPAMLRRERAGTFRIGTGETYDFTWRSDSALKAEIEFDWIFATERGHLVLRQPIIVPTP